MPLLFPGQKSQDSSGWPSLRLEQCPMIRLSAEARHRALHERLPAPASCSGCRDRLRQPYRLLECGGAIHGLMRGREATSLLVEATFKKNRSAKPRPLQRPRLWGSKEQHLADAPFRERGPSTASLLQEPFGPG